MRFEFSAGGVVCKKENNELFILVSQHSQHHWYVFEKEKIRKTVYYFLMEYVDGDIAKHDQEMENVEWLPKVKVEERLTYGSDKVVWREARKLI